MLRVFILRNHPRVCTVAVATRSSGEHSLDPVRVRCTYDLCAFLRPAARTPCVCALHRLLLMLEFLSLGALSSTVTLGLFFCRAQPVAHRRGRGEWQAECWGTVTGPLGSLR